MKSRLATLVLLLLAAWWLYDFAHQEDLSRPPPEVGGLLFPGLETRAISQVSLTWEKGYILDVEREPGGPWRIVAPTDELAQAELMEVVLDDMARARVLPLGEDVDPAEVGLDPPRYTLAVSDGQTRLTLQLGDRDAFGSGVYARRAGDDGVMLTSPGLLTLFEQYRNQDYVDKHLLRGLRGPADGIRVERPGGVVLDAARSGDEWVLRAPVQGPADQERVNQLVRTLQFIEQLYPAAYEPEDDILRQLGLPNASQLARGDWAGATLVQLSAPGEAPARVFLQAAWQDTSEECYAIREDLKRLLVIDRNMLRLLSNDGDFFRDRRLLPPVQDRATSLRIERGDQVLLDIRADRQDRWTFRAPERLAGEVVDTIRSNGRSSLTDVLGLVDGLRASGFCEPPQGEPDGRLVLGWRWSGADRQDRVDLFDLDGTTVRARASQRPGEGLLVDEGLDALLDPGLADRLRSLEPVALDEISWGRLSIELPGAAEPLTISRTGTAAGDGWTGDDPWGRRLGLGLDLLRHLRGLRWQPLAPGREHPWRVTFGGFDGKALGLLSLRRPAPGEDTEVFGEPVAYAVWSGTPGLELAVPAFWIEQLEALTAPQEREPLPGKAATGG